MTIAALDYDSSASTSASSNLQTLRNAKEFPLFGRRNCTSRRRHTGNQNGRTCLRCRLPSSSRSFDLPKDDKMSNDLWGALRVTLDSTWLSRRPTKGKSTSIGHLLTECSRCLPSRGWRYLCLCAQFSYDRQHDVLVTARTRDNENMLLVFSSGTRGRIGEGRVLSCVNELPLSPPPPPPPRKRD